MTGSAAQILDFWHAVELFSPQPVPRLRDSRRFEPIVEWSPGEAVPWRADQPLRHRAPTSQTAWRHHVYLGVFELELAVEELEERFGRPPDGWRESVRGQACLGAFAVSDTGRPLVDTYTVSSLAWALGRSRSPGVAQRWLDGFEDFQESAREAFAVRMALLPDDDEGARLSGLGFRVGPEIDGGVVEGELSRVLDACRWPVDREVLRHPAIVRSAPTSRRKKWSAEDFDFLNSFFLGDLRRVRRAVGAGDVGVALETYLALPDSAEVAARADVRRRPEALAEGLQPRGFPLGRWPSPGGWPLVCSQQLGVNEALARLGDAGGLFAINGPPGTGKTTLLRDLVAAVVVRRADALARLRRSADAFTGRAGWWQAPGYRVSVQGLRPDLMGHEMVVASTNNGAVENVTREIPGREAVADDIPPTFSYFEEVGTSVIDRDAWALLAAPLGKKRNRSSFATNFWFGPRDREDEEEDGSEGAAAPGRVMRDLLREAEELPPPDWAEAVADYRRARREVERIAEERQGVSDALARSPALSEAEAATAAALADAARRLAAAGELHRRDIEEVERRRERTAALEERLITVRRTRPGVLELVLTRGRAWSEWRDDQREVRDRLREARRALDQAEERAAARDENRRLAADLVDDRRRDHREAERRRRDAAGEVEAFQARHPSVAVPTLELLRTEARERSSPWVDEEWNRVRSRLFLAALDLHRTLILCEAKNFRRNLQGAIDLLTGKVPSGAPPEALKAAWATLFLVVPVVSTTFSSFDRLFASLGREDLGWLFVDEAGQAVPQAAVGAIWRSRRVVVVGDPMQLEPIVTLPARALEALREQFAVAPEWRPDTWSVQHLADRRNPLGTSLPQEGDDLWVGAPLRVHRRCDEPMFSLANRIAYDGMMVNGVAGREPLRGWPASAWLDVRAASSEGNWILEEGRVALALLDSLPTTDRLVVLSPFRHVVRGMRELLRGRDPDVHVGTVHTFQGRETDAVVLVLGGSVEREGALDWAASRPNLLNVAATRARRRLYVVGNRSRWRTRPFFSDLARSLEVRPADQLVGGSALAAPPVEPGDPARGPL